MKKLIFIFSIVSNFTFSQSTVIEPNSINSTQKGIANVTLKGENDPTLTGIRIGGTLESPTNTLEGSIILKAEGKGWANGAVTSAHGHLNFKTSQAWNAGNRGTLFDIYTTPNGESDPYRRLIINHNGRIGVGQYFLSEPQHTFEVQQPTNTDRGIAVYRYGGDAPTLFGVGALGVQLVPLPTDKNNVLLRIGAKGYDSTNYTNAKARIDMVANQDWSASSQGTEMRFFTTAQNQTEPVQNLTIRGNGNVGIGEVEPKAKLVIDGDIQLKKIKTFSVPEAAYNSLNRDGASVINFTNCFPCDPGWGGGYNVYLNGIEPAEPGTIVIIINSGHFNSNLIIDGGSEFAHSGSAIVTPQSQGSGNITLTVNQSMTLIYMDSYWLVIGISK
jgi:hypothetical protein